MILQIFVPPLPKRAPAEAIEEQRRRATTIGPDQRNFLDKAFDATEIGRFLRSRVLGGFAPTDAADPRGLRLPERFAEGAEGTLRGAAEIIATQLPNTEVAGLARDFVEKTNANEAPPPSNHPFAVAAQGLGSMAAPLLAAGVATAFGLPSIAIFGATASAAFPGMYGESVETLRSGGASEEEIRLTAPVVALGNSVLEAVVPRVLGKKAVVGPASRAAGRRIGATLIRLNSEGLQEGTTESAQSLVNIAADAFVNDNPAMTRENALQLARDFYAGYVTAITASGGIDAVQAAGPKAGEQLQALLADESGTAPRVVTHQDFQDFSAARAALEKDGFTKAPLESSAIEGLSPEAADEIGQRFIQGDEEVLVSRNTRPGEGPLRATFFDARDVIGQRAAETHNTAPLESRGSTLTREGRAPKETPRFLLSPFKDRERTISSEEISEFDWLFFRDDNKDLLAEPNHFVGTWTPDPNDPANKEIAGNTFLDISIGVSDASEALQLAKDNDQEAVFDTSTGKAVSIADLEAMLAE